MPYLQRQIARRPFLVRRGLRGLGDTQGDAWQQLISNISIRESNGNSLSYQTASAVEQAQILSALAATSYLDQFPATGWAIAITVNPAGSAADLPAFTLTTPHNGVTSSTYHAGHGGVGPVTQKYQAILQCGKANCGPVSNAGGVLVSSLPANFQVAQQPLTAAQIAAAFSSSAAPVDGSGLTVLSGSGGIPWWLLLAGGGLLLFWFMGGKR
jgi:hypothetical protein